MFKKVNIITNVAAVGIISLLILYGHYGESCEIVPIIGLTAISWFIIIFCSHRKSHKKEKVNTRE